MKILTWIFAIAICTAGCRKFIAVEPPRTDLITATVFNDDVTATAAVTALYASMIAPSSCWDGGSESIVLATSLSSDELVKYTVYGAEIFAQFSDNLLLPSNSKVENIWRGAYEMIYMTNAALKGLSGSTGVSEATGKQLEGEAKFMRAFTYFYLVNLFGDVPLALTIDYEANAAIPRSASVDVYKQIVADLTDAQSLMNDGYEHAGGQRVRASKGAATALLARVYLYTGEWEKAEAEATKLINQTDLYELVGLGEAFLANNRESIFQTGQTNNLPGEVVSFSYTYTASAFTPSFMAAFEPGDGRRDAWIDSYTDASGTYYSSKKYVNVDIPPTEYGVVLRLAEQYLIRAEARAQQSDIEGAQEDLNEIRHRAQLGDTPANDRSSLLDAVLRERRIELSIEWGHRWLDIKRSGRATEILSPVKPQWKPTAVLYPIPQTQIDKDPAMRHAQNPGYD